MLILPILKTLRWNIEKNTILLIERGITFEIVAEIIKDGKILEVIEHPNQKKYPNQNIMIINISNYIYMVPYVETESELFLKTIIPSRKLTKLYLGSNNNETED